MVTDKTTRPLRADAQRNYDRIVATARDAFAECGNEVPLDDIAKRACVGAGTLYRHALGRAIDDADAAHAAAPQLLLDFDQSQALLVFTAIPGSDSYGKLQLLSVIGQHASPGL